MKNISTKNKLIFSVLSVLVIIIFILIFQRLVLKKEIVDVPSIVQPENLIIADSYDIKTMDISDPYVSFDVKYPYFKNASNDFNFSVENLLKEKIDQHKKNSEDNWKARYETQSPGDDISKVPTRDEDKFSFASSFVVVQSNLSYISYVLQYGGYDGGAHGYENNVSFNYDVKNQKVIELKDLFPNDPLYLDYLSLKTRDYLKKEFAIVREEDKKNSSMEAIKEYTDSIISSIESGTLPKDENFSVFTFTGDNIKIYFAQYQVGPYSLGMPEVEVSRK